MQTSSSKWAIYLSALGLSACALTSRSEPMHVHYFTLEDASATTPPATGPTYPDLALRLGRIDASDHLSDEIAFRNGAHSIEFFDDTRWTEKPQEYVRRALWRALFQQRGLTRAFSSSAPVLDIELVDFEELLGPHRRVRLQFIATLHDDKRSLFQQTFTIERPVSDPDAHPTDAAAAALAGALNETVERLADRVVATLTQRESELAARNASAGFTPTDSERAH